MLHDITKTIHEGMAVWPGDVEYKRETVQNGEFSSSSVTMSLHTGTHMDAPRHRFEDGRTIDGFDPFMVPALLETAGDFRGKAVLLRGPVTPEEASEIVSGGTVLVGTASISIDHPGTDAAHKAILGAGIPVIENLVLDSIVPGEYLMLAFPLKFQGPTALPSGSYWLTPLLMSFQDLPEMIMSHPVLR